MASSKESPSHVFSFRRFLLTLSQFLPGCRCIGQTSKKNRRMRFADLPADILNSIQNLLPLDDYLRFAAVCTSWHSAAKNNPLPPPRFNDISSVIPWLFFPNDETTATAVRPGKTYTIPIPPGGHHRIISSVGPYLIIEPPSSTDPIRVVDPFSFWAEIGRLPPPATLGADEAFFKIVPDDKFSVAVAVVGRRTLAYAVFGSDRWISIWTLTSTWSIQHFNDLTYHPNDGLFYAVAGILTVAVIDPSADFQLSDINLSREMPSSLWEHCRIVASRAGVVFMVLSNLLSSGLGRFVDVYKLTRSVNDHGTKWRFKENVKSLDGCCLFLGGQNQSICLSVEDYPDLGLKSDCIYFSSLDYNFLVKFRTLSSADKLQAKKVAGNLDDGLIYNVADRSSELFCGGKWRESLELPVQDMMWLTPPLHKLTRRKLVAGRNGSHFS